MVRSGSAAHLSNYTRLWCSKYPQSTRKIFLGKLTCVAQAHTTGRLTRSNAFARSRTRATAATTSSPALYLNLSIPIRTSQTVRWAPPFRPSVASQSTRYFSCHFATSGALKRFPPPNQRRHQRNRPLTRDILRYLILFCQIQEDFWVEAITFYSCLCLEKSRRPLQISLLQPWQGFLQFLQFLIFPRPVLHVPRAFVTLPMLCPFFPLCFTTAQQPGILFFLQDLCSFSPCCGLREFKSVNFCRSPALPSALLIICATLC